MRNYSISIYWHEPLGFYVAVCEELGLQTTHRADTRKEALYRMEELLKVEAFHVQHNDADIPDPKTITVNNHMNF